MTRLAVLASIGFLMTVGVYGLVAGIVKLDDLGLRLIHTPAERPLAGLRTRAGYAIVAAAPYLMSFLSVAGTTAMFLVGGGILAHGLPALHHSIEALRHGLEQAENFGATGLAGVLGWLSELAMHGLLGVLAGTAVLLVVSLGAQARKKNFA